MAYMKDARGVRLDSFAVAQKRPRVLVPFGDSITYLDCGLLSESPNNLRPPATAYATGSQATGMYAWANYYLGHPFKMGGNAGVPGDTTAQMLARVNAMLALPSDIVAVQGGANDWTVGVAASQTGAQIAAGTIANLGAIYDRVLKAGKVLLAVTTHSRSTMNTADGRRYLATVNRWIAEYARSTPGVLFADTCSVITDPLTGAPYNPISAGLFPTSDGTHPNAYGASLQGKRIADALRPICTPVNPFSMNGNVDPLNFSRNPSNTGATGTVVNGATGTPGTQWSVGAASGSVVAAASKVARTDGEPGEWTRVVLGPDNPSAMYAQVSILWDATGANGVKPGDKVMVAIEARTAGLTGCSLFSGGIRVGSGVSSYDLAGSWTLGTAPTVADGSGIFLVEGYTIPVGETFGSARVNVQATSGIIDLGRSAVYKI